MSLQKAQHLQRPRGWRDFRKQRGNQLFGVGHLERVGASEGPAARPVGSGPASPLARRLPPARLGGRLGGAKLAPPSRWSFGLPGRLMGRPARVPGSGPRPR